MTSQSQTPAASTSSGNGDADADADSSGHIKLNVLQQQEEAANSEPSGHIELNVLQQQEEATNPEPGMPEGDQDQILSPILEAAQSNIMTDHEKSTDSLMAGIRDR
eukprot:CAMPEP_0204836796 /NCGR_PEP_ID=MMETSP1346-20131115/26195_1 /ASSEMBLY_ACC=CAM_ASM_000771 /TAXON_ID=215587 /ORGANISM="Aplanochytrium stocchinoi, Strain GSBS06" /LENGTH=105 /DNA_ID=CAMNT_0051971795 /DNA_START=47 /DNA_END=361 /DNA_ORIENTATION=-